MTPADLLEKAARALSSSRSLLAEGDTDGACNRAYYAMFNAARAALIASGAPPEAAGAKTHSGLQASFNQYLIKAGALPRRLGADLRRAEQLRLLGDYLGNPISEQDTNKMLGQAANFVEVISSWIATSN
ncbi:MAG: HEPN domain-containing protein [Methylocystis sp.]|nr:HEPN domain-containing protein [Methylocystis sp.]MBI3276050.1 HEPN domain-containing protein [Methylocystis sp.]